MAARKKKTRKTTKAAGPAPSAAPKRKRRRKAKKRRGGAKPQVGLHALIGRAVADPKFLGQLLKSPERTIAPFKLDRLTKKEVLRLLATPAQVKKLVASFRKRFGRIIVEAV